MSRIKPVPGKTYTIVKGDNLSKLAAMAYGNGRKWRIIWNANKSNLRSGDPNLIFPGEVVFIPGDTDTEQKEIDLPSKGENELTIIVEGYELKIQSARAIRTLDTAADGWSAKVVFNSNDKKLVEVTKPYRYPNAQVYVGGRLIITGVLYLVEPELSAEDGSIVSLQGGSYTMDLIDSSVPTPYQRNQVNLKQVAESICEPFGIPVIFETSVGGKFKRTTADKSDKCIGYLGKLAKQREVLISSTKNGELLFTKAVRSSPVAVLEEGIPPLNGVKTSFNGRERFRNYKVIGSTPRTRQLKKTVVDDGVSRPRSITIEADESDTDLTDVAKWNRSKQLASALSFDLEVLEWYDKNGDIWRENTMVTVKSSTARIPDGVDLLVRSVEFVLEPNGRSARLSVVPLETYTGEELPDLWK